MSKTVNKFFSGGIQKQLADDPNQLELNEKAEIKTKREHKATKKPKRTIILKLDDTLFNYVEGQAESNHTNKTQYLIKLIIEDIRKAGK